MQSVTAKGESMSEPVITEPVVTDPQPPVNKVIESDPDPNPDPVDKDKERAISDMLKYKSEVKDLKDQLSNQEIAALKSKEDWKKIAEIKEKEANDAKDELTGVRKVLVSDTKMSAIRNAALEAGIRKEALDDLDLYPFEDVVVESTSTGRVNVLNAKDAVDRLKLTRPHLFGSKATNINSDTPGVVTGGKVSYDDVEKARIKAEESGDYAPYKSVLFKYKNRNK